jgi:hypothetical protein
MHMYIYRETPSRDYKPTYEHVCKLTILTLECQAQEWLETYCFWAARRWSYGKRIVFVPPGAGGMENIPLLSDQLPHK